jgi:hypothetical protein
MTNGASVWSMVVFRFVGYRGISLIRQCSAGECLLKVEEMIMIRNAIL